LDTDSYELRSCLSCFGTGVTVVTVAGPDEPRGITVNAFSSVSLDPPLVMISINKLARSHDLLVDCPFAVNILSSDQERLALNFAGRHQPGLVVPWKDGAYAPYLGGSLAHLECTPYGRYGGGDHTLFLGEVRAFSYRRGDALGYFRTKFARLPEPIAVSPGTVDPFELPYDAYE
jgi:flavin reductase (DIM6/NTAB) family NADH-FMN oxidoreductase RutF